MIERSAQNLVWVDLEFTNLDPSVGFIMQAAMIVTTKDLVPIPPPGFDPTVGGLLYDVSLTPGQASTASAWVRENQADQLARSQGEEALPIHQVEDLFIGYLLATCEIPDDKRQRPLLAGNSVHGDFGFIRRHMTRLEDLLSFRLLDVTSLKEIARRWLPKSEYVKNPATIKRWYPGEVELKGEVHDALFDIKASLAEANFYRHHLFVPECRPPEEVTG
ncbi:MAG: hypothetical protein KDD82_25450 [Planctomycetes bacterium]|nr:hypothetical protein [Planctomycetota bacterium]